MYAVTHPEYRILKLVGKIFLKTVADSCIYFDGRALLKCIDFRVNQMKCYYKMKWSRKEVITSKKRTNKKHNT